VVAVVILACMMMFTVTDVCLRYFFNNPIKASDETTEFLMVIVSFLGLAWCASKGMHIKVNLIVGRFPQKPQTIIDIVNYVIVIGVCALIASQLWRETLAVRAMGKASDLTGIPYYPFYFIAGFGFFLLLLIAISLLVKSIKAFKR
jgi:TRAP-type C4-dicarboxylate transport system permease small subunit